MDIKIAKKEDYKAFINFQKNLFKGDKNFRDAQSRFLRALLYGQSCLLASADIKPIMVVEADRILGVCILAVVDRMNDTLQMSFLDFVEDKKVFALLLDYSKAEARKKDISKVLIGLNIHINYGLGLLDNCYDKVQSLGSGYNPRYYIDYIESFAKATEELVSYKGLISDIDMHLPQKVKAYVEKHFHVKKADFKDIENVSKIYSQINNQAFKAHKYYYKRRESEDIELFKDYKLLLKEENLLFVYHGDKPVGFLLWYPDFNQLVPEGKELGAVTVIKTKLGMGKIDTVKFTEIGIIPQYQHKGAMYALLDACHKLTIDRYVYVESGWILDGNFRSKGIGERFVKHPYKRYKVFEIKI